MEKEMITSVKVLCYRSKTLANGEHPLMVRVTKDRKVKYVSLGVSVKLEHWNFEGERPKRNCPNKEVIEKIISDKEAEYKEQILDNKAVGKEFTAQTLVESVKSPHKPMTVQTLFDEEIDFHKSTDNINYWKSIEQTKKKLTAFKKHLDIPFSDIDVDFLKKFERWMRNKGLKENSMGIHCRNIRTLYNTAIRKKYVKKDLYPFDEYKCAKLKNKTVKRSLTKMDMKKIIEYGNKYQPEKEYYNGANFDKDYTKFAIDIFSFIYYMAGINFTDVARLTYDNIVAIRLDDLADDPKIDAASYDNSGNAYLHKPLIAAKLVYVRKKTKKEITIPFSTESRNVMTKYFSSENKYLFPILQSSTHKTEQQKFNRIHKILGKVNESLNNVCKALDINIDFSLTTYVGRHTYATAMKRGGVNVSEISETLGHSNVNVTQTYLNSFEDGQIRESMKCLNLDNIKIPLQLQESNKISSGNEIDYV